MSRSQSSDDFTEEEISFESKGIDEIAFAHRWKIIFVLLGLLFLGIGIFLFRTGVFEANKVEIIGVGQNDIEGGLPAGRQVVVEISGAVQKPGVYKFLASDRIERLLIEAGGLSVEADREWIEKNLNRAAKLIDGQKIYIPKNGEVRGSEQSKSGGAVAGAVSGLININTSTAGELDSLPGIGAVRAQAIIDNRPYSSSQELLIKKIVPSNVYEKIKDRITAP